MFTGSILGSCISWIIESLIGLFNKTTETYSENSVLPVLVSPEIQIPSGIHFDPARKVLNPNPFLIEGTNLARVIEESSKLADRALATRTSS